MHVKVIKKKSEGEVWDGYQHLCQWPGFWVWGWYLLLIIKKGFFLSVPMRDNSTYFYPIRSKKKLHIFFY